MLEVVMLAHWKWSLWCRTGIGHVGSDRTDITLE